jgi:spermidine/putrescine transport system ATP-binding protein
VEPVIALESLRRRYAAGMAVDGINLTVERGEFFSLLGPSGCGKTTTLRLIAGFDPPDSGRVRLEGRDVTNLPPQRRPVNTVFQNYALFPHLTVWENVAFGPRARGLAAADIRRRVAEALAVVQLEPLARRRPHELSGGQQQRVALARALVNRPVALLLDEPLAALDPFLRRSVQGELKRIQRELGLTVLMVTHDQEEALALSDRLAVMRAGRIEQVGTPRQLYDAPTNPFVAEFLGRANLLADDRSGGWLLVRPEQLRLQAHGPTDGERGQRARIVDVSFQGSLLQVTLAQEVGPPLLAQVSRQDGEGSLRSGEVVWAVWDPATAHPLPANLSDSAPAGLPRPTGSPP